MSILTRKPSARTTLIIVFVTVTVALGLLSLPYGLFRWKNALAAYGGPPISGGGVSVPVPLVNGSIPPLVTVTCNTSVYDYANGNQLGAHVSVGQSLYLIGIVYDRQ